MAPNGLVIDLSHPLTTGMRVFPGDPCVEIRAHARINTDGYRVAGLHLGSHSGTHLDAPSHLAAGGRSVDEIPLQRCMGRALVLDATGLRDDAVITPADVAFDERAVREDEGVRIALIRTGWDRYVDSERSLHHPVVSIELADALIGAGIDVLGVDTLSPDATLQRANACSLPVHERFLGSDRLLIENLCGLEQLDGGSWWFAAFPLRLAGVDGSPVRAVAWRTDADAPGLPR